ncbi:MAG TPA: hypothetical protein VKV31_01715, partial [bacterium]|nr:hypothetical protein [bacterium]
MDPWRDCKRRFTAHFIDRAAQRFFSHDLLDRLLLEGSKIEEEREGEGGGKPYVVRWKGWS